MLSTGNVGDLEEVIWASLGVREDFQKEVMPGSSVVLGMQESEVSGGLHTKVIRRAVGL